MEYVIDYETGYSYFLLLCSTNNYILITSFKKVSHIAFLLGFITFSRIFFFLQFLQT